SFAHARATAPSLRSFRATSARRTPRSSRANTFAIAAPMPCDAPVMRMTGFRIRSADERSEIHEVRGKPALHALADHAHRVVRVQRLQVGACDLEIADSPVGIELAVQQPRR